MRLFTRFCCLRSRPRLPLRSASRRSSFPASRACPSTSTASTRRGASSRASSASIGPGLVTPTVIYRPLVVSYPTRVFPAIIRRPASAPAMAALKSCRRPIVRCRRRRRLTIAAGRAASVFGAGHRIRALLRAGGRRHRTEHYYGERAAITTSAASAGPTRSGETDPDRASPKGP